MFDIFTVGRFIMFDGPAVGRSMFDVPAGGRSMFDVHAVGCFLYSSIFIDNLLILCHLIFKIDSYD